MGTKALVDDGDLAGELSLSDLDQGEMELQSLLLELGGQEDLRVRVTRMEPPPTEVCETYPAVGFTVERIRTEYGPGKYKCSIIQANGRIKTNRIVQLAKKIAVEQPTPGALVSDPLAMLEKLQSARNASVMQWATLIATTLSPVVIALIQRPSRDAPHIDPVAMQTQFLTQLATMKELFGSKEPTGPSTAEIFIKAVELVKDIVPGGSNDEGGIMGAISKALPLIQSLLPQPQAQRVVIRQPVHTSAPVAPTMARAPIAPPAVQSAAGDGNAPTTPQEETAAMLAWIKGQLDRMLVKAEEDRDPGTYAEVLLDELPSYVTPDQLVAILSNPDWFEQLLLLDARIKPYRSWFTEMHAEVFALLGAPLPRPEGAPGMDAEAAKENAPEVDQRPPRRGETITVLVPDKVPT